MYKKFTLKDFSNLECELAYLMPTETNPEFPDKLSAGIISAVSEYDAKSYQMGRGQQ